MSHCRDGEGVSALPNTDTPRERPILFSAPMIRALLAGKKTQTRRLVKPAIPDRWRQVPWVPPNVCAWTGSPDGAEPSDMSIELRRNPFGVPGDRLWVRETFWASKPENVIYRADGDPDTFEHEPTRWSPSIHMPRRASRIDLEVTGVRVERLQDISERDILAEGVTVAIAAERTGTPRSDISTLHHAWALCWDSINGDRATWASNPWVWVVSFKRVRP